MAARVEEYKAKRILNVYKKADEGWFWTRYSAHAYKGCQHACEYCYARSDRYLQFDDPEDFSRLIMVKVNAPKLLDKELAGKEVDVISVGDWQPAEERYMLARRMLEVVRDHGFPLHVIEKSDLLLRDLDLLKEIASQTWCCVSYSISTVDQDIASTLEPNAPSPERRLRAVGELRDAGILAGIAYMPIVPYITDNRSQILDVVRGAKEHGASYVLPATMTLQDIQAERFQRFLGHYYPELREKYRKLYGSKHYPKREYSDRLNIAVKRVCDEIGMPMKIDRPVFKRPHVEQRSLDAF